jgi:scyllo-inositol 2-dehydrogenase (NADP+)
VIKVGVVGLGKMGLSHHALLHAHPEVEAVACDSSKYVLGVLEKNTGVSAYGDYERMLAEAELDAVVIATPSSAHAGMARAAFERGLHVFCEKPLTLSAAESEELSGLAAERGLVTQVGYHNRFVAAFAEVRSLLDAGAIGEVTHVLGEAYGPVVLKQKGGTWRSRRSEGGGCLYDYAAHVINLLNWYLGEPTGVGGTALPKVFSADTDDAAFATLYFPGARTGQLSVYWSDESYRKMTTRITIWGTAGRIFADRQECQVYLRDTAAIPPGYEQGWNVRYTTELTEPVWFYLRGEEYSAQVESFVAQVRAGEPSGLNGFAAAAATDRTIEMMVADAAAGANGAPASPAAAPPSRRRRRLGRRAG